MKFVFLSNYFNHHQKTFSDNMFSLTNGNYTFVETEEMSEERRKLGYKRPDDVKYVNSEYLNGNLSIVKRIVLESDILIAGAAPENLLGERIKNNKLTFRYSERLFKRTHGAVKNILIALKRLIVERSNENTYMLCSSAFTVLDYSKIGKYKDRCYKWGYFPETKVYEDIDRLINDKNKAEILWCGRFLDWKHPDDAIKVANLLNKAGYKFNLNIIGTGEMECTLKNLIKEYNLENCVHMLGSMSSDKVRLCMEKAQIFLFTSDQSEGWGAVLNEAMNSGCAVVASHLIGSVPFMVNNRENGLIYHSGNIEELFENVKFLLDNCEKNDYIAKNAYYTIVNEWNSAEAAKRFIKLSKHIWDGDKYPDIYESGPCSKVEIIEEDWF